MLARLHGTIAYRQRIAMPEEAYAVVEVRNSAGPDAQPVVAEKRIDMNGAQPPMPYILRPRSMTMTAALAGS